MIEMNTKQYMYFLFMVLILFICFFGYYAQAQDKEEYYYIERYNITVPELDMENLIGDIILIYRNSCDLESFESKLREYLPKWYLAVIVRDYGIERWEGYDYIGYGDWVISPLKNKRELLKIK